MSTSVYIDNFPAGTTVEDVRAEWERWEAPILSVDPVEGGDADKLAFIVKLDIDADTARIMADRRRDRVCRLAPVAQSGDGSGQLRFRGGAGRHPEECRAGNPKPEPGYRLDFRL